MKKALLLLLCCFLVYLPAHAGQLEDATLQMRYRLGDSLRREAAISQELDELKNWLDTARQQENKLKENLENLAVMQQEISQELPAIMAREQQIQNELTLLRAKYAKELRAVYLYAPDAGEWFFASAGQFNQALETQLNLDILLKARLEGMRVLQRQAAELELNLNSLQARQRQMFELAEQLKLSREELTQLGQRRQQTLQNISEQQQQLKQNQAALTEAQNRLQRTSSAALPGIGSSQAPATGALENKGSFFAPVQGNILTPAHKGFSLLEAKAGSQVRAPWAGVVAFADYVPGYGQLLVIDHGERLHTVLAHLSALEVSAGQMLAAGQVVGSLDDSGLLYLEIRLAAKPQAAEQWLFLGVE